MDLDYDQLSRIRLRFIDACFQELDTQRQQNRQVTKEKVFAVARAKDMVRDQSNAEVERIKDKVKQDNRREMERLREQIKSLEEEVRQQKTERQQTTRMEKESSAALERVERTVVNEINEECRRSASLLGITPRRVHQGSVCGASSPVPFNGPHSGKYRTTITVALANLRACNEEMRSHVNDIRQELETHRTLLLKTQRDKEESLDHLRRDLEKEKNIELESLKDRLFRLIEEVSDIRRIKQRALNYEDKINLQQRQNWTIQQDLRERNERQQKEIERLEKDVHKLAISSGRYTSPPRSSFPTKFQGDNSLQRSKYLSMTSSVPDLSSPTHFRQSHTRSVSPTRDTHMISSLEERFRSAEKDAALAEHHTKQNQAALSKKMTEMNKLQNTLSNQTKELMDLERAYSHLHRQYNQRPSSPTRMFSATR